MLIINADDWGRTAAETDAALACHKLGRITSVSAMVLMEDSERAAQLAIDNNIDVGLHLNFSQRYNGHRRSRSATDSQDRIVRFMERSKYAVLFYNPLLRQNFRDTYRIQIEEFVQLYGKFPSHIDGHQHRHLCANMIFDGIIADGEIVRRSFSFRPGEKSFLNRAYRHLVDKWLARKYRLVQRFFSLGSTLRANALHHVFQSAKVVIVELMTHPIVATEYAYLTSSEHADWLTQVEACGFTSASFTSTVS